MKLVEQLIKKRANLNTQECRTCMNSLKTYLIIITRYFCMYCSNNSLPETAHSPNIDTLNCSCIEPTELITVSTYTTPSSIVVLTRVRLSPC